MLWPDLIKPRTERNLLSKPVPRTRLADKLKRLPASQFENFVYDLLVMSGLRNGVWRSPGPDAGRDIEGEFISVDLSEHLLLERWYVECKRYAHALDWPAVFAKIAYAQNHGADFLLFVTTALLSPRCKEEIARRELGKLRPAVRIWDAPTLEIMCARYPVLLYKYNLVPDPQKQVAYSFLPIVAIASKTVQAAYGNQIRKEDVDPALEFAAALVEIISARARSTYVVEWNVSPFRESRDMYPWTSVDAGVNLSQFDAHGLRALLAGVRFFSKATMLRLRKRTATAYEIISNGHKLSKVALDALSTVGVWGDLEITAVQETLVVGVGEGTRNG